MFFHQHFHQVMLFHQHGCNLSQMSLKDIKTNGRKTVALEFVNLQARLKQQQHDEVKCVVSTTAVHTDE